MTTCCMPGCTNAPRSYWHYSCDDCLEDYCVRRAEAREVWRTLGLALSSRIVNILGRLALFPDEVAATPDAELLARRLVGVAAVREIRRVIPYGPTDEDYAGWVGEGVPEMAGVA